MSGPGYGKKFIGKADVYIHEKGKSLARITHIDIELDELNKIIKPKESTYIQGKEGGVFIGLKKEMIKRAEKLLKSKKFLKNCLPPTKVEGLTGNFSDSEFFRLFGKTPPKGGGFQLSENNMKTSEIKKILEGKIFIYPTDTIYGLGCNALNKKAVNKIKKIKLRDENKPLSVIAPSFNWINENMIVDIDLKKYLPGPYTLILKKRNKDFLNHISNSDTLGIRIPDCDFTKTIQKAEVPFITTSVNLSGETPITFIKELSEEIKNKVDFIIDGGELNGNPSTLIINGKEVER